MYIPFYLYLPNFSLLSLSPPFLRLPPHLHLSLRVNIPRHLQLPHKIIQGGEVYHTICRPLPIVKEIAYKF
jgi:hypothetical protein